MGALSVHGDVRRACGTIIQAESMGVACTLGTGVTGALGAGAVRVGGGWGVGALYTLGSCWTRGVGVGAVGAEEVGSVAAGSIFWNSARMLSMAARWSLASLSDPP
jgi:hypothetical protein